MVNLSERFISVSI